MSNLIEGTKAPQFKQLAKHTGKTVVLYFYPKDMTPGCTTQACEFRDAHAEIVDQNAVVIGISPDSPKSHEKFTAHYGLPFELVPDEDREICKAYGVWKEKSMYGKKYMGIERTTVIVNPDGKIQKIFHKVTPRGHAKQVLETLQS